MYSCSIASTCLFSFIWRLLIAKLIVGYLTLSPSHESAHTSFQRGSFRQLVQHNIELLLQGVRACRRAILRRLRLRAASFVASVRNWLTVADRPAAVAADLAACACASFTASSRAIIRPCSIMRAAVCAFAVCDDSALSRSAHFFSQPRLLHSFPAINATTTSTEMEMN